MRSVLAAIEARCLCPSRARHRDRASPICSTRPRSLCTCARTAPAAPRTVAHAAGVELRETAGNAIEQIVGAAHDPDVAALVLGARGVHGGPRPAGRTALDVITRVGKPVAVVPPQARAPERVTHILIPLEGTIESSHALEQTVKLAHRTSSRSSCSTSTRRPPSPPSLTTNRMAPKPGSKSSSTRYIATPHERIKLGSPTRRSRRRRGLGSSRDSGRPARARLESEPQSGPRPRRLRDPRAQPGPGTADTRGLTLARARCG